MARARAPQSTVPDHSAHLATGSAPSSHELPGETCSTPASHSTAVPTNAAANRRRLGQQAPPAVALPAERARAAPASSLLSWTRRATPTRSAASLSSAREQKSYSAEPSPALADRRDLCDSYNRGRLIRAGGLTAERLAFAALRSGCQPRAYVRPASSTSATPVDLAAAIAQTHKRHAVHRAPSGTSARAPGSA